MKTVKHKESKSGFATQVSPVVAIASLAILGLAIPLVYAWHWRAKTVLSDSLLETAREAIAAHEEKVLESPLKPDSDPMLGATKQLRSFLALHPDDAEARILLATAFDKSATASSNINRNIQLHLDALAVATEERAVLLLRVGNLLNEVGRFSESREVGEELILKHVNESANSEVRAAAYQQIAQALVGQIGQVSDASLTVDSQVGDQVVGEIVEKAIELNPDNVYLPIELANLYRILNRRSHLSQQQRAKYESATLVDQEVNKIADQIVAEMVSRNANNPEAYLTSHLYKSFFEVTGALSDLHHSAELNPQDSRVNYLLGKWYFKESQKPGSDKNGNLNLAKSHFEKTIASKGNQNVDAYSQLGVVLQLLGDQEKAIEVWQIGLEKSGRRHVQIFQRLVAELVRSDDQAKLKQAGELLTEMKSLSAELARTSGVNPKLLREWSGSCEFLTALMHYQKKEYATAIELLERLSRDQGGEPSLVTERSRIVLAEILGKLGRRGEAAALLEANDEFGLDNDSLGKIGQDYLTSGDFNKAISVFRRAAQADNSTGAWQQLAKAIYLQQSTRIPANRQWKEFDLAIANAKTDGELGWRTTFLKTLGEIKQSEKQDLESLRSEIEVLTALVEFSPDVPRQLSYLYNERGEYELSDQWCETYTKMVEKTSEGNASLSLTDVGAAIFRSELLCKRSQFQSAIQLIHDKIKSSAENPLLVELLIASTNIQLWQGNNQVALEGLKQMVHDNPDSGRLLFSLADLVMRTRTYTEVPARWESSLEKFESDNGRYTKLFQAARILKQAKATNSNPEKIQLLERANKIRAEIGSLSSAWSLLSVLGGDIYFNLREARAAENADVGLLDELKENEKLFYEQAARLGERDTRVLLRLAMAATNGVEAKQWTDLLGAKNQSDGLVGARLKLAFRQSNMEEANRLAGVATDLDPENPKNWIRRALVQWNVGEREKAQQSAAKAEGLLTEVKDLSTWQALFNFRVSSAATAPDGATSQIKLARGMIEKMTSLAAPGSRLLVEAELLAAVLDPAATEKFLEAEKASPQDESVLVRVVEYFSNVGPGEVDSLDQAIRAMDKLMKLKPDHQPYRKKLASLLSRRGLGSDWQRLGTMFASRSDKSSLHDTRTYAILLLQKKNVTNSERIENLGAARDMLQKQLSAESADSQTADWMVLGQVNYRWSKILDDEGQKDERLTEAIECFEKVAAAGDVTIAQLFAIGTFYIGQGDMEQAQKYSDRVQGLIATSDRLSPLPLSLHVQMLAKEEGNEAKIQSLVESFATKVDADKRIPASAKTRWYVTFAQVYNQASMRPQAINWFRKAANGNPNLTLELSSALLANSEFEQALRMLTENYGTALKASKPYFIASIANVLVSAQSQVDEAASGPDLYDTAKPVFDSAINEFGKDPRVLVSVANVHLVVRGETQKAIELYKSAQLLAPKNALILNNLATVLSDDPGRLKDAIETIDYAIEVAGDKPQFLDTKAVILRKQSRLDESEKILVNIVHPEADSRYWWHLAEVNWQRFESSQDRSQVKLAKNHLQQAIDSGLESAVLTPGEKARLLKLKSDLKSQLTDVQNVSASTSPVFATSQN